VGKTFSNKTLKESKFTQLDRVLCKWFTAMCSEGKPVTEPLIIEKAQSFYAKMKLTDKCTCSEGSNKILPVRTWVTIGTV
jgi:Tc5 transposase DNA-binding domain.